MKDETKALRIFKNIQNLNDELESLGYYLSDSHGYINLFKVDRESEQEPESLGSLGFNGRGAWVKKNEKQK